MGEDKKEIVVSVFGLDKLLNPTMAYAGEQIRDLVEYFVERAKKRLFKRESREEFHGLKSRTPLLFLADVPIESIRSINPYEHFPAWSWPIAHLNSDIYINKLLPNNNTKVDRSNFLNCLCQSLSLDLNEKKRVIEAWPRLEQWQVDALLDVFKEERSKFETELLIENPRAVWSLIYNSQLEWGIIVLGDRRVGLEAFLIPSLNGDFLFSYFSLWPDFWKKSGEILMHEMKDYRSASRSFSQACNLSPESSYNWLLLGHCYVRLQYFDYALDCFEKVKQLSPKHTSIYLDICEIYLLKRDFKCAIEQIEAIEGKDLNSDYEHVLFTLEWLCKILTKNEWFEPCDALNNYVSDIESESGWNWNDLREFINLSSELDHTVRKKTSRYLQRLIALTV